MEQVLTAQQAKTARTAAQLSQGKVATDIGINRSYLSLFESGKYVLDDGTLTRLRDYYQARGVSVNSQIAARNSAETQQVSAGTNSTRLRDGFLRTDDCEDVSADVLLAEYAENRQKISALCAADLTKTFLYPIFGVDRDEATAQVNKVLTLMARNFTIMEQLHGQDTVLPPTGAEAKREKRTTGDFVSAWFGEMFGPRDVAVVHEEANSSVPARDKGDGWKCLLG